MKGLSLLVDDRTNGVTRMMLMNSPLLSSLFTICLVGFGGALLGLLLSTLACSERSAVSLLPLALLPQMLLSRVAFGDGGNPWSDPSPLGKIALLGDYLASDSRSPQGIALLAGSVPMLSRPGTAVLDLLAAPAGRSGSTGDVAIKSLAQERTTFSRPFKWIEEKIRA